MTAHPFIGWRCRLRLALPNVHQSYPGEVGLILTFGGEKGGVGKSTLSVHIAYMLRAIGRDPLLVDADPQGSATNFAAARDGQGAEPRVESVQKLGKGLAHEIRSLSDRYTDLIIDTGGRDSVELRLAMLVS